MSTPNKLRGGGDSELTRLKRLSAEERQEIFAWKDGGTEVGGQRSEVIPTNAEVRKRIGERFGIHLRRDGQLSQFWQWQWRQAPIDHLGQMMSQDEQLLQDQFPGLTRDQLREVTIKRGYALADMMNDPKLGLKVAAEDRKDRALTHDVARWQFDAAKACLKLLPALKAVASDKGLSEPEKVQQIRLKLFGVLPEESEMPAKHAK
jgi:hypothetical protein